MTDYIAHTLRLPLAQDRAVRQAAAAEGVTVSRYIRVALQRRLAPDETVLEILKDAEALASYDVISYGKAHANDIAAKLRRATYALLHDLLPEEY